MLQDLYVQDERYVAGARMRRSDFFQVGTVLWNLGPNPQRGFASHIPVLYRKVPFILNITARPEARYCAALASTLIGKQLPNAAQHTTTQVRTLT